MKIDKLLNLLERNVLNVKEIEDYINNIISSKHVEDSNLANWLKSNFRNYLINNYEDISRIDKEDSTYPHWANTSIRSGQELYKIIISPRLQEEISSIIDYLQEYKEDINSRLSYLDAKKKSDDWHKSLAQKKQKTELMGKFKEVFVFSDGFKLVQLLDKTALKYEGDVMGHCVGGSNYCSWIEKSENNKIYSLRDTFNKPHGTMQVVGNNIVQIQGKENKGIVSKYKKYLLELLNDDILEGSTDLLSKHGIIAVK